MIRASIPKYHFVGAVSTAIVLNVAYILSGVGADYASIFEMQGLLGLLTTPTWGMLTFLVTFTSLGTALLDRVQSPASIRRTSVACLTVRGQAMLWSGLVLTWGGGRMGFFGYPIAGFSVLFLFFPSLMLIVTGTLVGWMGPWQGREKAIIRVRKVLTATVKPRSSIAALREW